MIAQLRTKNVLSFGISQDGIVWFGRDEDAAYGDLSHGVDLLRSFLGNICGLRSSDPQVQFIDPCSVGVFAV